MLFKEALANSVCDYNTTHRLTIKGAKNKVASSLVLQKDILLFHKTWSTLFFFTLE